MKEELSGKEILPVGLPDWEVPYSIEERGSPTKKGWCNCGFIQRIKAFLCGGVGGANFQHL